MCRHVIPVMRENGGGSIVNIASVAGLTADVALSAYAMPKVAVIELIRLVAVQYGKQSIRCNVVASATIVTRNVEAYVPDDYRAAYIRNRATPFLGAPQDVSRPVAVLASDRARYMTDHVIPVVGGITAALVVVDRR